MIYERHKSLVFNVAANLIGDRDAALDVAQDVFVSLYQDAATLREPAALSTWLYKVTVRRSIDAGRRITTRRTRPLDASAIDAGPDASEGLTREETRVRVREALGALPPKLREVAVLRYLEDLPYEAIARALSLNVGTVKSRLFRAHEALEASLGPLEEGR